jgi:hypothetical protein
MGESRAASGLASPPRPPAGGPGRVARGPWPAVATLGVLAVTVALLHWEGRRWWCACGQWFLWTGEARGPHTSQHLLDPYSLTHVLHGLALCGVLVVATPRWLAGWRCVLAVGLECAWEVLENSALVIDRYRTATAARGYEGDTIANSVGDVLCCAAGYYVAARLGWRRSVALAVATEVLLVVWIRDSLLLNVVMLIFPLDGVRAWQAAG